MFDSKKIDQKIDEFILKEPTPENLNIIGDLFLKKGDKKTAVDYYLRAAKNTAMPKKTIALYKKILRVSPLDTEAYEALIDILEMTYNIPEAIKYLNILSRLYQNRGETSKFAEIQRRTTILKHDWEKRAPRETPKEKSLPTEALEVSDQDVQYMEKTGEIKRDRQFIRRLIWIGIASLSAIIIFSSAILLIKNKKKLPGEYQIQQRAGSYNVMISSITEKSIKDLQNIFLTPEDFQSASFNLITIKTLEACIPFGIIENPHDHIVCLNDKGNETRPLPNPVTDASRRVTYKYGVCANDNGAVFTEFCIACPKSHSSGIKINGLVPEPLVLSWGNR